MASLSSALPSHCLPRRERGLEEVRSGCEGWRGAPEELGWGKMQTGPRGRRGKLGEGVEARDVVDVEDFKEMPWEPRLEEEGDL